MFGFKSTCSKYGTFVCDGCKSAHQGISHRCKSIGQATFTPEDMVLLRRGNDYATKTYLGRLTRAQVCQMAPKGNPPAIEWQGWIQKVYENKEFYVDLPDYVAAPLPGEAGGEEKEDPNRPLTAREKAELRKKGKISGGGRGVAKSDIPASPRVVDAPVQQQMAPVAAAPVQQQMAPAAAPAVDLMGGFGAPAPATTAAGGFGGFGAPAAALAPVDTASMLSGFGAAAPAPAPAGGGFGFGAPAPAPAAGGFSFGSMQGQPPAGQGPTPQQMQQQQLQQQQLQQQQMQQQQMQQQRMQQQYMQQQLPAISVPSPVPAPRPMSEEVFEEEEEEGEDEGPSVASSRARRETAGKPAHPQLLGRRWRAGLDACR